MSETLAETLSERVQRVDPARTLAARLASKKEADHLIGLYAFHYEIARVAEAVSDPTLGEIRLQWWREAIEEIGAAKKVRAHDAAQALERAIKAKDAYPLDLLIELIDARERDLDQAPFTSIEDLNAYTERTAGKLVLAAAHLLARGAIAPDHQKGLLSAGRAWGLAGLAREAAIAKQFNAKPRLPISSPAEDIAAASRAAYKEAREILKRAPAEILPAYAYAALIPDLTKQFGVEGASPFAMRWRIFCTSVTGRI